MRPGNFAQETALGEDVVQQRVVIKHIDGPGIRPYRLLEVRDDAAEGRFSERIEEKEPATGKSNGRRTVVV